MPDGVEAVSALQDMEYPAYHVHPVEIKMTVT